MFNKFGFLPITLVSCILLQTAGFSQQFRSARRVGPPSPFQAEGLFPFGPIDAVADFNGDGRPDFLTFALNQAGTNFPPALMLQNPNGTFTRKDLPSIPSGILAVADLNGDGKMDIVTVLSGPTDDHGNPVGPATMVISFGNGDATFRVQSPVNLPGNALAVSVLIQDLNHDGKPDIITTLSDQYGDATIQTFLNTGAGTFRAGATYTNIIGGDLLAGADFNGDGFPDLAINNNFQIQILLGHGDGSFRAGATYNIFPSRVGVGDFNRDHHQDLVVLTTTNSKILLGKGDGTFTAGATLDTSFGTSISGIQFGNPVIPTEVYVGDLNQDGIPDLAITSVSSTVAVSVYYGKGNGKFADAKAFNISGSFGLAAGSAAFADFNRDGRIDVLAQSASAGYTVAYGSNDGGFNAPVIAQARNAGSIAKGDFNGDGIDDLAVVEEPICTDCPGTFVRVFLGTAHGFLAPPRTYAIPVRWGAIAAGDLNRDGKVDLVVTRNAAMINDGFIQPYSPLDLAVLLGRGDGTFEAPASSTLLGKPAVSTFSASVYLVDVNHDGKLDLVGDWGTALGKGNGQFDKPIPLPSNLTGIIDLAPGDFNAAGTIDLAVATVTYDPVLQSFTTPAYVNVLSGDGKGSFHFTSRHSTGIINNLITADLNGDGLSDILYTFNSTQGTTNQINLGADLSRGQNAFSTATYTYPSSFVTTDIVAGDFNRDGKMDVALFGLFPSGGDMALLLGTGSGALNRTPRYYQGSMGKAVVLDLNGDSAPDIAATTTIGIARLLNTGRK